MELVSACRDYDMDGIKSALARGADVMSTDGWAWAAYLAAQRRQVDVLAAAIAAPGFDPNARSPGSHIPLHTASRGRSVECVDMLLEAGADPTLLNIVGHSVLHRAATFAVAERLLADDRVATVAYHSPLQVRQHS